MSKEKILFLEHHNGFEGGQKSLLALLESLNTNDFEPMVLLDSRSESLQEELSRINVSYIETHYNRLDSRKYQQSNISSDPIELILSIPFVITSFLACIYIILTRGVSVVYSNSYKAGVIGSFSSFTTDTAHVFRARSSRTYSHHGWIDHLVVYFSDYVFCNSDFVKQSFQDLSQYDTEIKTIYNPLDTTFILDNSRSHGCSLSGEFGLPPQCPLVGMVGRITPRKRQEDFVKSAALVNDQLDEPAHFFIVGEEGPGRYLNKIQALISDYSLGDYVHLTGFRNDIADVMSCFDIMVLPSIEEPLARVCIEGQLLGIPLVAADSGGTPEIIEHGKTGLLFPPKDCEMLSYRIVMLLSDVDMQQKIIRQARNFVTSKFSLDNTVREEERVFKMLSK